MWLEGRQLDHAGLRNDLQQNALLNISNVATPSGCLHDCYSSTIVRVELNVCVSYRHVT
jgi:hypothetical protein